MRGDSWVWVVEQELHSCMLREAMIIGELAADQHICLSVGCRRIMLITR